MKSKCEGEECPTCGGEWGECTCYKCWTCLDHGVIIVHYTKIGQKVLENCPDCKIGENKGQIEVSVE